MLDKKEMGKKVVEELWQKDGNHFIVSFTNFKETAACIRAAAAAAAAAVAATVATA